MAWKGEVCLSLRFGEAGFAVQRGGMYKDRGGNAPRVEIGAVGRRHALDKHWERSSPSTSRGLNGRERDRSSLTSTSAGKQLEHGDPRPASLSKNKCSDGRYFFFLFSMYSFSSFYVLLY